MPLVALAVSLSQRHLYSASSQVLINRQNLADSLTNTPNPSISVPNFAEIATTDAQVADTRPVAEMALAAAGIHDRTPTQLLDNTTVVPSQNSDIIQFNVTDQDPGHAKALATSFANSYAAYNTKLATAAISAASRQLAGRIAGLRASHSGRTSPAKSSAQSALLQSLLAKQQQLATLAALQSGGIQVVSTPMTTSQVQPRTLRNVAIGLIVGLVLAIVLAYARHALDKRVHSMEEVGESLDIPLLARIPSPPGARSGDPFAPASFSAPADAHAEAFRMLRLAIEFARVSGQGADVVLVTSALEGEGKSTTVANLAIAEARAGKRVVALDLDMRRPTLHRFFDAWQSPGLTDLMLKMPRHLHAFPQGESSPDPLVERGEAAQTVGPEQPRPTPALGLATRSTSGNGANHSGEVVPPSSWQDELDGLLIQVPDRNPDFAEFPGALHVLPAGTLPPDPGELLALPQLGSVIAAAHARADLVLIDSPPLLRVGDALAISRHVDTVLLVVQLELMRRPMLSEVGRVLAASPAPTLGYVLTGAERDLQYTYGGAGYYGGEGS